MVAPYSNRILSEPRHHPDVATPPTPTPRARTRLSLPNTPLLRLMSVLLVCIVRISCRADAELIEVSTSDVDNPQGSVNAGSGCFCRRSCHRFLDVYFWVSRGVSVLH